MLLGAVAYFLLLLDAMASFVGGREVHHAPEQAWKVQDIGNTLETHKHTVFFGQIWGFSWSPIMLNSNLRRSLELLYHITIFHTWQQNMRLHENDPTQQKKLLKGKKKNALLQHPFCCHSKDQFFVENLIFISCLVYRECRHSQIVSNCCQSPSWIYHYSMQVLLK